MLKRIQNKFHEVNSDFILFLVSGMFLGISQSVDTSTFNNFLRENYHMLITQRSALEFPRELPGFLVFLFMGFLYLLGDIRIAAIANFCAAIGMTLLGWASSSYTSALLFIFIYSTGQHIYMPVSNSITMGFAKDGKLGRKMGQVSAANTAALVVSSAVLYCLYRFAHISYRTAFTIGAVAFVAAGLLLLCMKPQPKTVGVHRRFVFHKEYKLFYWLSMLFGARKQIFITFGPWVLVDFFQLDVSTMTILFFIISIISIFTRPFIGYCIDRLGEKVVLGGEAAILVVVCLGYAYAASLFDRQTALIVICACYIIDQLSSSVSMARSTYLKKIALCEEDVSPTLSLGTSIDHIVSMVLPLVGGLVWYNSGAGGYKYVFLGGAAIALVNLISSRRMKIPAAIIPDKVSVSSGSAEYMK